MAYFFLNNKTLGRIIKEVVPIDKDHQKELLDRLPYMNVEQRIDLLKALKNIILLNAEKEEVIARLKKEGY